jgi:hypothetical protein
MLHLLPQSPPEAPPPAYAEALSRLASVRHALRLVDASGGGPASDLPDDQSIAAAWADAATAKQRNFERRSGRLVGTAAAGVEALLIERQDGRQPHSEASQALSDQIRRELHEIAGIILA